MRTCAMRTAEKFSKIGEAMLREARSVQCSAAEFRDGLRSIRDEIDIEIDASESTDAEARHE